MKNYEDEAFDDIEKAQQRKVAHGITDGNKKDAALRLARDALRLCTNDGMIPMYLKANQIALAAIDEALGDV